MKIQTAANRFHVEHAPKKGNLFNWYTCSPSYYCDYHIFATKKEAVKFARSFPTVSSVSWVWKNIEAQKQISLVKGQKFTDHR